jgi:hypothetical protein
MDKEVLRTIENVEIFPVISLGIFFIFFIIMLVRVWSTDKSINDAMAAIPLTDGQIDEMQTIDKPSSNR